MTIHFRSHIWRIAIIVGAAALVTSCGGQTNDRNLAMSTTPLKHPNGLSLAMPATGWTQQQTSTGFVLQPATAGGRDNPEIRISLNSGTSPIGIFPETRTFPASMAQYRIDISDGGSGGTEHILEAWTACGTGHAVLEQVLQAEPPEKPDFSVAWAVLATLKCN
jgi:hypothetical protein